MLACFAFFLPTKHIGVHMNSFKRVRAFQIELEFGSVGFWRKGKNRRKPLGAKERTNKKPNPHMASTPGFESGPHWWEASALTTAPPLFPTRLDHGKGDCDHSGDHLIQVSFYFRVHSEISPSQSLLQSNAQILSLMSINLFIIVFIRLKDWNYYEVRLHVKSSSFFTDNGQTFILSIFYCISNHKNFIPKYLDNALTDFA